MLKKNPDAVQAAPAPLNAGDSIPVLNKNKVVLGLSGGVDSTTAALLLKQKGLEVIGLFLDVTGNNTEGRKAAETAAAQMNIGFVYRDSSAEFRNKVIADFCREYTCGRTPNPCVRCNPEVKFKALCETADSLGAMYIATGHYAKTYFDNDLRLWFIRKAVCIERDQSYMLYRLPQEVISRLLLPLGDISGKEQVRSIARQNELVNADLKDSQEICFIDHGKTYAEYLIAQGIPLKEGNFVDLYGNILGRHNGIPNYTIGQRKGLGIALGRPYYVVALDPGRNEVILSENEQDLFKSRVNSVDNHFDLSFEGLKVEAKIRSMAKPAPAFIRWTVEGRIEVIFDEPQRAPAPGQSIVYYLGDFVLGGGLIEQHYPTT